ncbi:two-component system sensor histidine kinase SapS [Enterococcus sp. BWR-S5]|uniref:two-component system sensor histidine kinase SapS n=1 Tax=Enterococcus sp. BWR-S5 TaxID=2787714 RepID=UPI0019205450|nr:sensor histidine kinase [Enterococcus sp. BWR-S5]MBL1223619.1 sensor histidine kinase [Enterococcus sp. BWR-S5]
MAFLKYLRDQWLFISGWLSFMGLTSLILWLSPSLHLSFSSIGYLLLLGLLLLLAVLAIDFFLKKRWWKALDPNGQPPMLDQYLKNASRSDEKLVQEYVNGLLIEHNKVMEQVIDNQEGYKDYLNSWVHEIKVPLAALHLLLDSFEDDISDEAYYQTENELVKIDEHVDQVLYYSRLDSFSRDYLIQEYSLKKLVQSVVKTQANYFIQKNLRFSLLGEDQRVLTDGKWLEFIFKQLLSNAVKYTPAGGEITVQLSKNKEGVLLSLTDSGIGIPKKDIHRIFDKGFTGENGRLSEQHATGLGLYLAKSLSDKLGHQLAVESEVGKGTTLQLFFPVISYYQEARG